MARLTADQLGAQITLAETEVDLPELGGSVRVRALTKGKRDRIRKGVMTGDTISDPAEFEIRMLVAGLCEPKVTRDQALIWKEQWSGDMWDRVILAIAELGAVDPEEVEQVAAAEFPDADD